MFRHGELYENLNELRKTPWLGKMKPFKMIGNVYFVGTYQASSHLIDTGDGLIMIDTGYASTAYLVLDSIYQLGFDPRDIKHGSSLQMPLYLMALTSRAYPLLNKAIGDQAPILEYIGNGGLIGVERQKIPSDSVLIPAGVTYFSTAVRSENTESMKTEQIAMWDAAKRLTRSGVLLCDSDLLHAASHLGRKSIVGTSKTNRHFFKEEFQDLFAELGDTISRIYGEMRRGVATACPNPEKKSSPCGFCKYNAICRVNAAGEKGDQYGA